MILSEQHKYHLISHFFLLYNTYPINATTFFLECKRKDIINTAITAPIIGKIECCNFISSANKTGRKAMDVIRLKRHCNIFPAIKDLVFKSPITDMVCRATHKPPRLKKHALRINLVPSQGMLCSTKHPLESSNSPTIIVCRAGESSQNTHRCTKAMTILNKTTQLQTTAIVFVLCSINAVTFICFDSLTRQDEQLLFGRIAATQMALTIWLASRTHGISGDENKLATIPKIKAGPALLQNPSIRSASSLCRTPLL